MQKNSRMGTTRAKCTSVNEEITASFWQTNFLGPWTSPDSPIYPNLNFFTASGGQEGFVSDFDIRISGLGEKDGSHTTAKTDSEFHPELYSGAGVSAHSAGNRRALSD
jgi:hypothetical protein